MRERRGGAGGGGEFSFDFPTPAEQDALGLTAQMARGKSLLKSGSACTTILSVDGHRSAAP